MTTPVHADDDTRRVARLASVLGLSADLLGRHIVRPLAPPVASLPGGWQVPAACAQILAITDGFWLFGTQSWDGFRFWGSQEYRAPTDLIQQMVEERLFPIFGQIPHLASVSTVDGTVVASDWEVYRRPEHGWRKRIAPTVEEYLRTLIKVREAYGEGDQASDWWHPYAAHGTRYDLEP